MLQYYCNGKQNQNWDIFKDTDTNRFKFRSAWSSKCWDDWDGKDGETLRQYNCDAGTQQNQQFMYEPDETKRC